MHQAEKHIRQIVEEIGRPSYMQEFLKLRKDKRAVADVAEKLKQFEDQLAADIRRLDTKFRSEFLRWSSYW